MNDDVKELNGSSTRDAFKHWHKTLDRSLYSCDIDLLFIVKNPEAKIKAIIDYKAGYDKITFSEIIAYNHLKKIGIKIYILSTEPSMPPYKTFTVFEYITGDWRPRPECYNLLPVIKDADISQYEQWEKSVRNIS